MNSWKGLGLSTRSRRMCCVILMSLTTIAFAETHTDPMTLRFDGKDFVHRWSESHQHEFTPAGQEDLAAWTDMLTILVYPYVYDGDDLAAATNNVLSHYKSRGRIVKTDSKRRTRRKPAEHLIVAVLGNPGHLEAVFARFKMVEDEGVAIVVSHRTYGAEAGDKMSDWLANNGSDLEATLTSWASIPPTASLEALTTPLPKAPAWIASIRAHLDEVRSAEAPSESRPDPLPDVAELVGRSRNEVIAAIGAPTSALLLTEGYLLPAPYTHATQWFYAFYKLPPGARGGGLELMLKFGEKGDCVSAEWRHTQ